MNKQNYKLYSALACLVVVAVIGVGLAVNAFSGQISNVENFYEAGVTQEESFGSLVGPNIYSDVRIHGTFSSGRGILSLATSTGTTVLTGAQLLNNSVLELTVNTGATATFTLPATSTLPGLLDAGATRKWLIHNATSSTMALTIGAGAGMDLIGVTTNDDVIDATEYSELTCTAQADTDLTCIVSELLHVD